MTLFKVAKYLKKVFCFFKNLSYNVSVIQISFVLLMTAPDIISSHLDLFLATGIRCESKVNEFVQLHFTTIQTNAQLAISSSVLISELSSSLVRISNIQLNTFGLAGIRIGLRMFPLQVLNISLPKDPSPMPRPNWSDINTVSHVLLCDFRRPQL